MGGGRERRLSLKTIPTVARRPRMNSPPGFEEVGNAPAWARAQPIITPTASSPGISSGASTSGPSSRLRIHEPAGSACRPRLIGPDASRPEATRSQAYGTVALLTSVPEHGQDGHHHDLQVEPERPVLDVVVVPLHSIDERGLPSQAVDLRPAGDARLDAMTVLVAMDRLLEQGDDVVALGSRADHGHVSSQNVDELGQLVQRAPTQERTQLRAAVLALDSARGQPAIERLLEGLR